MNTFNIFTFIEAAGSIRDNFVNFLVAVKSNSTFFKPNKKKLHIINKNYLFRYHLPNLLQDL